MPCQSGLRDGREARREADAGEGSGQDCFWFPSFDNHSEAEKRQIGSAGVLYGGEGDGGTGENDRNAQSCGKDVHHAPEERTQGGEHTFALTSGQTSSENVKHSRARRHGKQKGSG